MLGHELLQDGERFLHRGTQKVGLRAPRHSRLLDQTAGEQKPILGALLILGQESPQGQKGRLDVPARLLLQLGKGRLGERISRWSKRRLGVSAPFASRIASRTR